MSGEVLLVSGGGVVRRKRNPGNPAFSDDDVLSGPQSACQCSCRKAAAPTLSDLRIRRGVATLYLSLCCPDRLTSACSRTALSRKSAATFQSISARAFESCGPMSFGMLSIQSGDALRGPRGEGIEVVGQRLLALLLAGGLDESVAPIRFFAAALPGEVEALWRARRAPCGRHVPHGKRRLRSAVSLLVSSETARSVQSPLTSS